MTQGLLAASILFGAVFLLFLGYTFTRVRMIFMSAGFFILLTGVFTSYANWLPQVPPDIVIDPKKAPIVGLEGKTVEEIAEIGKNIIFGNIGISSSPMSPTGTRRNKIIEPV